MRKIPAALAVLGLVTVGLAGCSMPGSSSDCSRPAVSDADVMDLIDVTGDTDEQPEVDMYTPLRAPHLAYEDVVVGDGTPITAQNQLMVVDVALFSGATGEPLVATAYDGDLSSVTSPAQWTTNFPGFEDALHCATDGSRIAVALSPDDMADGVAKGFGLEDDDTAVAVVDVRKVYLPAADGANQFNSGFGLPTVVRAPDGRPGLIIPDGAPPTDVVVQTLKKGTGEKVTGDQPVRVHYTGVVWGENEAFDSTWDGEPASVTLDGVVPGFAQALEGQTVGSQVLVVVPPDQGYGDEAQGAIPAGSTLVFVIDILGLDVAPEE
ncbi:FKBP-type peptidyl-prolyl cis-trans isomerase [Microbacterium yannicii]|uniref:peptidylprolyl isomerase n=1 Tax=Microbacterium yannicii TaxID=671622 RepID=A0ABP9MP46_9MICO|nr:FKBP-type peptidyl-prolyl cis-trans isomerase [Microbacterium yannicii]MCO5951758.1 FKBP-type peptidyl-prolyl cis-trans isomerase [Microbacterium yannicii]